MTETHLQSGDLCFVRGNEKSERMQKPTQIWAGENASKRPICSADQEAQVAARCVYAPAIKGLLNLKKKERHKTDQCLQTEHK